MPVDEGLGTYTREGKSSPARTNPHGASTAAGSSPRGDKAKKGERLEAKEIETLRSKDRVIALG